MRNFIILLVVFSALSMKARAGDFLISASQAHPATFVQTKPKVFQAPGGQLLFAWVDHRNGPAGIIPASGRLDDGPPWCGRIPAQKSGAVELGHS